MARYRARLPDEVLEQQRKRAGPVRPDPGVRTPIRDPRSDALHSLQRLAGNDAVGELLRGQPALQRADAGVTPVAADAGATTATASDPEIDGLDLQSDVADAARALRKAIPGAHFTSGRRTLEEDSYAVAGNIVANRQYVEIFAESRPKRLIKTWVDAHPTATREEISAAIVSILEPMNETMRSYWSLHVAGRAFDLSQSSCTLAAVQKVFPDALAEETHWHVQFPRTWSKP